MNKQMPSIDELIAGQYTAIREHQGLFDAFLVTRERSYHIGQFNSYEEAQEAAQDAQQAKWNG